jgi:hypothetical protein
MQPERYPAGPPPAVVLAAVNGPPRAPEPVNGRIGPPRPRPGDGPYVLDLGRLTRWLLEQAASEPEPLRYSADREHLLVTVTLADVDHVVAWAHRFNAHRPHRLPADQYIPHPIVQTEIAEHGWTIVIRCVEVGR